MGLVCETSLVSGSIITKCHKLNWPLRMYTNTQTLFMIYFSDIKSCRSVALKLVAVLLVAKVIAYIHKFHQKRGITCSLAWPDPFAQGVID